MQARIRKIAIDDGKVCVWPHSARFPFVYLEAMEVDWDPAGLLLYAPRPRP